MYLIKKKDADNIYDGFSIDFIGINGEIYLTILKENNLIDAENKIYINGIKLKKVKIYISNKQLYNFLNSNPQITYSFDLNNNYQSI